MELQPTDAQQEQDEVLENRRLQREQEQREQQQAQEPPQEP